MRDGQEGQGGKGRIPPFLPVPPFLPYDRQL
jgi:hypothetical protein